MRTWTLFVSICAHVVLVVAMVIAPIFADSELPEPRRATTFPEITPIEVPPVPVSARQQPARPLTESRTFPLTEPREIEPEAPVTTPTFAIDDHGEPAGNGIPPGDVVSVGDPAPPPPPRPTTPIRVSSLHAPTRVTYVEPVYPRIAVESHTQGIVIVEAVIDESGAVRDVRVLRSIALLDQAAVDAVRKWRFTPTLLNGTPVPIVMTVTVAFALTK